MGAYDDTDPKLAGSKQGHDSTVRSLRVAEVNGIDFGLPVFGYAGNDEDIYRYHNNVSAMAFDADFVASNSIVLTVDGVAVTAVVFNSTQAQTMLDLIAQVEADIPGASASSNTGGDNRTITIVIEDGVDRVVTEAITGGASQATGTETVSSSMIFKGFALRTQKEAAPKTDLAGASIDAGTNLFLKNESANVMVEGWITSVTGAAVSSDNQVYVITTGANQGKVTDVSTDNVLLSGAKFQDTIAAAGLADVRLSN